MNTENDYRAFLFLELSAFLISKYFKHDFITDWFCNFVEIHHWPVMNSKNDYRLVWICLGISAWNSHQHGEWLHFVFVFFRWKPLEPNIKPLRKPTLWFYFFFDTVELTCIGNHYYYRLVLKNQNFWAMNTENNYIMVLIFSWKSEFEIFRKQITTNWFSIFLEIISKPFQEPTVWFVFFLPKLNEYFSENISLRFGFWKIISLRNGRAAKIPKKNKMLSTLWLLFLTSRPTKR